MGHSAAVDDPQEAQAFYARVLGFTFDPVDGMDYATFRVDETPLGGLGGAQTGSSTGWTTCFSVASADEAVAVVEKACGG